MEAKLLKYANSINVPKIKLKKHMNVSWQYKHDEVPCVRNIDSKSKLKYENE